MKDYMVAHTFKSEELRDQYFEMSASMTEDDIRSNMKNENASFQTVSYTHLTLPTNVAV